MERKEPTLWREKPTGDQAEGTVDSFSENRAKESLDRQSVPNAVLPENKNVAANIVAYVILGALMIGGGFLGYRLFPKDFHLWQKRYAASTDTAPGCSRWTIVASDDANPMYSVVDICQDHVVQHLAPWLSKKEVSNAIASGIAGKDERAVSLIEREGSCYSIPSDSSNNDVWITSYSRYCPDGNDQTIIGYFRVTMELKQEQEWQPANCRRGIHGHCMIEDKTIHEQLALGTYSTPDLADRGGNCGEYLRAMNDLAMPSSRDVCRQLAINLKSVCDAGAFHRSLGENMLASCKLSAGIR